MHIRQLAVHYHAEADRLLLRVRSSDDSVFAVWLTRRLCLRLWPHLTTLVRQGTATQAVAQAAPRATPTLEAAAMLAESARAQVLKDADFSQPFRADAAQQPLGPEPLLAHTVQLTPRPLGALHLAIRDAQQRSVELVLEASMATAVRELAEAALRQADWGFALTAPADVQTDVASARTLN